MSGAQLALEAERQAERLSLAAKLLSEAEHRAFETNSLLFRLDEVTAELDDEEAFTQLRDTLERLLDESPAAVAPYSPPSPDPVRLLASVRFNLLRRQLEVLQRRVDELESGLDQTAEVLQTILQDTDDPQESTIPTRGPDTQEQYVRWIDEWIRLRSEDLPARYRPIRKRGRRRAVEDPSDTRLADLVRHLYGLEEQAPGRSREQG